MKSKKRVLKNSKSRLQYHDSLRHTVLNRDFYMEMNILKTRPLKIIRRNVSLHYVNNGRVSPLQPVIPFKLIISIPHFIRNSRIALSLLFQVQQKTAMRSSVRSTHSMTVLFSFRRSVVKGMSYREQKPWCSHPFPGVMWTINRLKRVSSA